MDPSPVSKVLNKLGITQVMGGKVMMVVMDDDPIVTYKASQHHVMSGDDAQKYKDKVISTHDIFLESLLPTGSYTKLYSYTHLLNGFALHAESEEAIEILRNARGVRVIHEDIKMVKMTTHTPEYLGITSGVWPELGGSERSGNGVVIGMIDTGINPNHPSFGTLRSGSASNLTKFKGKCESSNEFPLTACNGKIVGAQHFARAATAAGEFNTSSDYASPFDTDGHGSHTASIAAGNYRVAVLSNGYNYGYASGMAPGAHIAVYKAIHSFGGYMSDVVAAVDKAVEDGVDILSLSIGTPVVPPGPSVFLNILEIELLFATKAGVMVVQAVGNGGPASSSVLSFSPWITSVAASTTDRQYNNSVILGNGQSFAGSGLSPPTPNEQLVAIAAAEDICYKNTTFELLQSCQSPESFIPSLAQGKVIICKYVADSPYTSTDIDSISDTMKKIGASGFIITGDDDLNTDQDPAGITSAFSIPGILISDSGASEALMNYYHSSTVRSISGVVISFEATARILDGRQAIYTGQAPIVAPYSSRGPSVNNAFMQTADVLKPNIMAPGSNIWAAWTPTSKSGPGSKGQDFAVLSGTSMAAPHVAGVAALIKHKHPGWSPAAIASAMMTTADTVDTAGRPMVAHRADGVASATPFDFGSGSINPVRALDPGLVFDVRFEDYARFLCSVPGVDEESLRRAAGFGCPAERSEWCSDLNSPSVTVASLVGSRRVIRRVTNVGRARETYRATVRDPPGVRVTVSPQVFTISPNSTKGLTILLEASEVTDAYEFGEVVLDGDMQHVVRIPLAVFVSSTLKV